VALLQLDHTETRDLERHILNVIYGLNQENKTNLPLFIRNNSDSTSNIIKTIYDIINNKKYKAYLQEDERNTADNSYSPTSSNEAYQIRPAHGSHLAISIHAPLNYCIEVVNDAGEATNKNGKRWVSFGYNLPNRTTPKSFNLLAFVGVNINLLSENTLSICSKSDGHFKLDQHESEYQNLIHSTRLNKVKQLAYHVINFDMEQIKINTIKDVEPTIPLTNKDIENCLTILQVLYTIYFREYCKSITPNIEDIKKISKEMAPLIDKKQYAEIYNRAISNIDKVNFELISALSDIKEIDYNNNVSFINAQLTRYKDINYGIVYNPVSLILHNAKPATYNNGSRYGSLLDTLEYNIPRLRNNTNRDENVIMSKDEDHYIEKYHLSKFFNHHQDKNKYPPITGIENMLIERPGLVALPKNCNTYHDCTFLLNPTKELKEFDIIVNIMQYSIINNGMQIFTDYRLNHETLSPIDILFMTAIEAKNEKEIKIYGNPKLRMHNTILAEIYTLIYAYHYMCAIYNPVEQDPKLRLVPSNQKLEKLYNNILTKIREYVTFAKELLNYLIEQDIIVHNFNEKEKNSGKFINKLCSAIANENKLLILVTKPFSASQNEAINLEDYSAFSKLESKLNKLLITMALPFEIEDDSFLKDTI
jgi:hypothetical protein